MSAFKLVTISCDAPNCADWCDAGVADTAKEARARLRRLGWAVGVKDPAGYPQALDFCTEHAILASRKQVL